ncbi:Nicotinamide/nicotinic acid mononucleotide adenylyltransferase, partial [Lachnellula occidentalis]
PFEHEISAAEARIANPEPRPFDSQNDNKHAVCCFAAGPKQLPPRSPHITPKRCLQNPTRIDSMWLFLTYNLPTLEDVRDGVRYKFNNKNFEIMGGYLSPVGDGYKKAGLAPAVHRLRMCELAVESAGWLMVDPWEATNPEYIPTALVLDHFEHEINVVLGGIERPDGTRVPAKICLLAGADLVQTMSTPGRSYISVCLNPLLTHSPGVWSSDDLDHILGGYGACIIEREGTDIDDALSSLQNYKDNIHVVKQLIQNNVSSTKIRLFLRKELSIRYLIPSPVINYIEEHNLYQDDGISSMKEKGNAEGTQNSGRTSPVISSSGSKNHLDKTS